MQNTMNIAELYHLYKYISERLEENGDAEYLVYEPAVLDLYKKMLDGNATRKDFLVFAIKDMLDYVKANNIEGVKCTAMVKFDRIYGEEKKCNL